MQPLHGLESWCDVISIDDFEFLQLASTVQGPDRRTQNKFFQKALILALFSARQGFVRHNPFSAVPTDPDPNNLVLMPNCAIAPHVVAVADRAFDPVVGLPHPERRRVGTGGHARLPGMRKPFCFFIGS